MKKYKVGDIVEIKLPSGTTIRGWVLYISQYFKDVIGAVFPIDGGPYQVQYTNIKAAKYYGWKVVDFKQPTVDDLNVTKRIVGGEVFVGDDMIRPASSEDRQNLPKMLVKGMPIIFEELDQ